MKLSVEVEGNEIFADFVVESEPLRDVILALL